MSDPSKTPGTVDNPSSARRPVGSEAPNARREAPSAAPRVVPTSPDVLTLMPDARAQRPRSTSSDRLLLTPALMVNSRSTASPSNTDPLALPLSSMVAGQRGASPAARKVASLDRSQLVATIAELEAAVSSMVGDYEPDGGDIEAGKIPWSAPETRTPRNDPKATEAAQDAPEATDAPAAAPDHRQTPQDSEDSAADDPDDVPASEAVHPAQPYHMAHPVDPGSEPEDAADIWVDEDTVRNLVADIVRSELSGEMGERITRNVRKLVRREIYRILATRDFD